MPRGPVVADLVETGLGSWWAPGLAFLAGVVSFASPCVFPLVPGYLSFVAGGEAKDERRPVVPILLFIAGFAVVFTAFGAFTGSITRSLLRSPAGIRVSGALIVAFGVLMLLYALRVGSPRCSPSVVRCSARCGPVRRGRSRSGSRSAPGGRRASDPCSRACSRSPRRRAARLRGATLLFVYSPGLGVPFLLVGLGIRRLMGALAFVKRNYHWIAGVSGVVMVDDRRARGDEHVDAAARAGAARDPVGSNPPVSRPPRIGACVRPCRAERRLTTSRCYSARDFDARSSLIPGGTSGTVRPTRRHAPRTRRRRLGRGRGGVRAERQPGHARTRRASSRGSRTTCSCRCSGSRPPIFVIVEGAIVLFALAVPAPEGPRPDPAAGPREHPPGDRVDDPAGARPRRRRGADRDHDLRPRPRARRRRCRGERARPPVVVGVRVSRARGSSRRTNSTSRRASPCTSRCARSVRVLQRRPAVAQRVPAGAARGPSPADARRRR